MSVLLDSDLKEGNLKKIPHRESYVLDLESGQQVTLENCWENPEGMLSAAAGGVSGQTARKSGRLLCGCGRKNCALNPEKIGWYFTETAIVCYLEPYTIALPEEGAMWRQSCRSRMIVNKILWFGNTHQENRVVFKQKCL